MDLKKFNFKDLKSLNDQDLTLAEHIINQQNLENQKSPKEEKVLEIEEIGPLVYSQSDIDKIVSEAFDRGKQAGQTEKIATEQEEILQSQAKTNEILDIIQEKFDNITIIDTKELFEKNLEHLKDLAVIIGKKIALYALNQNLIDIIDNLVEKYINELKSKKFLSIRLNSQFTHIEKDLSSRLAKRNGIDFEIIFDDDCPSNDVEIKWDNGFIKRSHQEIIDEIESLIHLI